MNRIRLLPDHVANQIAAGEVVERPASVVKELVENALDAQTTRVTVEIQAGGRSLIRVTDDGLGMSRDDALLCLERHATSKIQRAEDLAAIGTMGFRGEALPSIASVSRFSLTTRERDSETVAGTRVVINGGKILEVKEAGSAPGTCVEVRQLFFNLPARRKFLRSEETERSHIQHYLTLAALANPEVAFSFMQDQRLIWQLPAWKTDGSTGERLKALQERFRALHGAESALLPVDFIGQLDENVPVEEEFLHEADAGNEPSREDDRFRVWGLMGAPGVSRSTRAEQHLFVNRRPVENRALNFALIEGYHTALMKGRYPVCCLFIEMDPSGVDVNIHPAKREVKFHREQQVRRLVTRAVRETLLKYHTGVAKQARQQPPSTATQAPTRPPAEAVPAPRQNTFSGFGPATGHSPKPSFKSEPEPPLPLSFGKSQRPTPPAGSSKEAIAASKPPEEPSTAAKGSLAPAADGQSSAAPAAPPPLQPSGPLPLLSVPLRVIGVVNRLYVVLESDRGMVLMDQHAAHERILFEQMLKRLEQGNAPSQRLLLPETVELPPRDAQFLREQMPVLNRLGVGLSEFGERTFLLDALPPFVKAADPRRFVAELVDELRSAGQAVNALRLGEQMIAKTVCRHAVKANDPLAGPELEGLLRDLRHCDMPYTCPHGRPTLIEMSLRELEKKFGRSQ